MDNNSATHVVHKQKRANALDGTTWTKYSVSIWSNIHKSQKERTLGHPALFPMQLVLRLIECFTTKGDNLRILDPFSGCGSTVVTAAQMGHTGIGFEINKEYTQQIQQRLAEGIIWDTQWRERVQIYEDDARNIPKHLKPNTIDMVITSPPYWNILSQKRTADNKNIRDYGTPEQDLAKIENYNDFLTALAQVFQHIYTVIKPGKYCIVIVMDLRKKNDSIPSIPTLQQ